MPLSRVALFAHFDRDAEIKDYIYYHLEHLARHCQRVLFISNSAVDDSHRVKLSKICSGVFVRGNIGLDFGMWRDALDQVSLDDIDELLLTNSSVFGPIPSLDDVLKKMADIECDFWGLTESPEIVPHLQSYFLVFRRRALTSDAFRAFWKSVLMFRDKNQVIRSYELGLSVFLKEQGLKMCALMPVDALPYKGLGIRKRRYRSNPIVGKPLELLRQGVPYVKLEVFRSNPFKVNLKTLRREMIRKGFDERLIQS